MDFTAEKELLWIAGGVCLLVGIVVWIIKTVVKVGIQESRPTPPPPPAPPRMTNASEVVGVPPKLDGPGKYRVDGVDRETQMDVTEYVDAASAANAKAKAELRGVVVTAVERAGD